MITSIMFIISSSSSIIIITITIAVTVTVTIKAIAAIEKGAGGAAFLQTVAGSRLQKLVSSDSNLLEDTYIYIYIYVYHV